MTLQLFVSIHYRLFRLESVECARFVLLSSQIKMAPMCRSGSVQPGMMPAVEDGRQKPIGSGS